MTRLFAVLALFVSAALPAAAEMTDAERAERWADLKHMIFGARATVDGGGMIALDAPLRAADAALVPVTISLAAPLAREARRLYLVIDNNPSPLAAVFEKGPAGDLAEIATRVRVDDYTDMHVVAETEDGRLLETARFVKAAGGCSAPAGKDQALAMQRLGRMKLTMQGKPQPGTLATAQLLISHPNNSGLQMDQLTRHYIPPDFVRSIRISYGGETVLKIEADISLSEDPSLHFRFAPKEGGELRAEIEDSNDRRFSDAWPVAAPTM